MKSTAMKTQESAKYRRSSFFLFFVLSVFLSASVAAQSQNLPDKIRGYKVHKAKISVQNSGEKAEADENLRVEFDFGEPELAGVSPFGVTLELGGEITVFGQSGTVDFITFNDFNVNGIPVEIEEYDSSFDFKKGETFELKKPVEIFINHRQVLRGASKEWREAKEKWKVTGRVFVFGSFKKFGFRFKRVIVVEVDIEIDTPLVTTEQSRFVFK